MLRMIWIKLLLGYLVVMAGNWVLSGAFGREVSVGEALAIAFAGIVIGLSHQLRSVDETEKGSSTERR